MTAGPQLAQCRAEELLSGTVCDWLVVLPSLVAVLADHRVSVADPGFRLRGLNNVDLKFKLEINGNLLSIECDLMKK
jgi:hypothetical protein